MKRSHTKNLTVSTMLLLCLTKKHSSLFEALEFSLRAKMCVPTATYVLIV